MDFIKHRSIKRLFGQLATNPRNINVKHFEVKNISFQVWHFICIFHFKFDISFVLFLKKNKPLKSFAQTWINGNKNLFSYKVHNAWMVSRLPQSLNPQSSSEKKLFDYFEPFPSYFGLPVRSSNAKQLH